MNQTLANRDSRADIGRSFRESGFHIEPRVVPEVECAGLASALDVLFERQQGNSRRRIGGIRNLLRTSPAVANLAVSEPVLDLVERLLGGVGFPVRAIYFDKTAEANWSVPWHQDLAIAVAERIDTAGFGPWSVKDGVVHVQPPCEILAEMLALRIHLDNCDADNGALKIIPGSHGCGELSSADIAVWQRKREPFVCEIPRGGALAMRPMLLHSSAAATAPTHRRVLHLEYAAKALPNGLQWFEKS